MGLVIGIGLVLIIGAILVSQKAISTSTEDMRKGEEASRKSAEIWREFYRK